MHAGSEGVLVELGLRKEADLVRVRVRARVRVRVRLRLRLRFRWAHLICEARSAYFLAGIDSMANLIG